MLRRFALFADMIKISHSIFALPFAFMGAFLAARGLPPLPVCCWSVAAMVGARSAAMSFNRLADARYDATNPRTERRHLVTGELRKGEVIVFTLLSSGLFLLAAFCLNTLAFTLAVPVLLILFFYSYTKRFTIFSHLVLGLCLGATPVAGWIAVTGEFGGLSFVLGAGVCLWVTGFDIIYACQDVEHDRKEGLFSLPSRAGVAAALRVSAVLHGAAFCIFCIVGYAADLPWPYWAGLVPVLVSLVLQHAIVKPDDLSRVTLSFFTANGIISLVMAAATATACLI